MATQPVSANQTVTLPPGDTTMSFTTADIKAMALGGQGSLIITFNDGHQLTVANFQDLAKSGSHIALQDGSTIDAKHLYETLASELPAINIGEPAAGQSVAYNLLPGQKYTIGFDLHQHGLHATEKSGALIITFGDHGQVILQNVTSAIHVAAADQPHVTYDGQDISLTAFLKDVQLAGILDLHHDAANSNDLAQAAQALAGVEPAAGGPGGGIGPGSAGFGSSILPAGFDGENPIGPIGRTELAYGIPTLNLAVYPGLDNAGPSLTVNGNPPVGPGQAISEPDAVVKENGSIAVHVGATLGDNSAAGDHLVVVVSGLPGAGVGTVGETGGVYNAANGTITYTLPAGQNLSTDLQFTPKAYSDVDFGQLTVTVTQYQSNGATQTASANLYVTTDAVAEAPGLTTQHATEEAGHTTAVAITTKEIDPDGSEHITSIKISGLPDGATLNHGVHNSDGSYTLTQADLTGLTVTTTKAVHAGDYTLTVVATSTETNLSGREADFSDNTATTTQPLVLTVTPNSIPVITSTGLTPNGDLVYEANLNKTTSVSDHVTVNYGVDGVGAAGVVGTGAFTASVAHLTSGGAAVTVVENGNTYTGTANGHDIFTLTVNTDGTYKFTLDGPLDHPDATNPHDAIALNFGIKATDSDGDSATGAITINVIDDAPVAHNDINTFFTSVGHASGNVVSGAGDSNTGGGDYLSHDGNNHVTSIAYGATTDNIVEGQSATIDGKYGELHIASDGSYTYTLYHPATGGAGGTDTPHTFIGPDYSTLVVPEGASINAAQAANLGELHSNMVINANTQVSGTITYDGAGYDNSLGAFTVNANGTLQAVQLVDTGINSGLGSTPNVNFTVGASSGASELGFFIVANGANLNNNYAGMDFSTGKLAFVYDYGQGDARDATVNDAGAKVSLVFTDASGHATVLQGSTYFTTDRGGSNSLNADGVVHTISGTDGSNTLKIGFEDLPNGGDKDYNDTVFTVQLTDHTPATPAAGSDTFTYGLTDNDGDTSKATLTFNGDGAPTISVNGGPPATTGSTGVTTPDAVAKENGHVAVPIVANLGAGAPAGDHLTVVVSGIPAGVGTVSAPGGVYDAAHGTLTFTLAAGQNLDSAITFTPKAYSDVDFGSLVATVTQSDPTSGTSQSASAAFYVTTDAVAEAPGLTVANASEEAGHSAALSISTKEIDPDGSEGIASIKISGLPSGATLSAGIHNSDGSYTLTQAQLTGLTISTTKATVPGDYTLTVVATSTEMHLSGKEVTYSDNSATTTQTLDLHVTANSMPVIPTPCILTVSEHNLNPTTSASETIQVNYGGDAGAGVTATDKFSSSLATLTSGGHAVTVTETGNVYTGTADGHTVFTMTIGADGKSTFTLDAPLDHPAAGNDVIALNFGAQATDADGDHTATTLTVHVVDDVPVANNDVNAYQTSAGHASGNVITGAGDTNTGGADTLSHDGNNHLTTISYNGTAETITPGHTATIDGQYGELKIGSDGSYTYTPFVTTSTNDTHFTGSAFGDLKDGQAVDPATTTFGEIHSNLVVTAGSEVTGTVLYGTAAQQNTVGIYTIDATGQITGVKIIDTDIGNNTSSEAFKYTTTANGEVGMFIAADGYNINHAYSGLNLTTGSVSLEYDYGHADQRAANIHDAPGTVSFVYTDASGHATVLGGDLYFTTDTGTGAGLNSDGTVHTVSGTVDNGATERIGFEDLPHNVSDLDYDDAVIDLNIQNTVSHTATGSDQFVYGLTDNDGDTSHASLTVTSGDASQTAISGTAAGPLDATGHTITGTSGNDVLISHGAPDTLYGGAGADTFLFDGIGKHGAATITDFNAGQGDKLDLSALLTKFDPVQNSIDNFVHATSVGSNTTISVDVTGSGKAANFVNVAVLQGVSHVSIDDLLAQHHLVAHATAAA